MVPLLPDLHEEDPSAEVVHDLLKPMHIPPLDCEVEFAASGDNSEWNLVLGDFLHLGIQEFSFFEMDVTFKIRRGDIHLQVFREKLVKPVGQR